MSTESDLTLASPKRTVQQFIVRFKLRLAHFPYEVPVAPLDGVVAAAVPRFEVVGGQVWLEMDVSWHAMVLQHSVTTAY
jgi:hypothetical protein